MVKGPGKRVNTQHGETQKNLSTKRPPTAWESDRDTMDAFQDGGQIHMNSEHSDYSTGAMEGSYMNPEMNSYGPSPGEPVLGPENYARMEGMHPGQMPHYAYSRQGFGSGDNNSMAGSEFTGHNMNYGQYPQNAGARAGYAGVPQPGMGPGRPGMGSHGMGMMPGVPGPYNPNPRMMSGQSISQQAGPTPTLNQLLQTPNSQPRYPDNNYDGYPGPQKGDISSANGPYGMAPQGWIQNQRGMGNFPPMPMSGSSSYRGQVPQNYNQQGYNQPMTTPHSQSQFNSQGASIQQQPQPSGQPPGSSPQQQRPSRQPSPHQQVSPAPSPVQRATPNPSPGPPRPTPQPSPGQQRSSQPSPSPSQRSSSSQLSPPGLSPGPGQQNSLSNNTSQHNHQSSPKDSSFEDVKGDNSSINSRPVLSPGSVGSRSNTPASNISGSSPMPPPLQDGAQSNLRMNPAQMSVSGYSQQMMPPPMGPGQMGYSQGNKMGPGPYYPNSQYPPHSGNYPMRQPGPGYQQNMYNGPSHMQGPSGPGPMYNNMGGPGMNRSGYMYGGAGGGGQSGIMPGGNNQYNGPPGATSQGGPPPPMNSSNPGPNMNGPPQGNMSSVTSADNSVVGNNGQGQGQTPIKGARAAAQAAMAAANAAAAARNQSGSGGRPNLSQSPQRMYNPSSLAPDPHSMPPQSMSPLSQMGQMNQMGYNSMMNNMPHPQNSVSPVPNAMGYSSPSSQAMPPGRPKMHNSSSVNSYGEQPLSKSKTKSKSKSVTNAPTSFPPTGMPNSVQDRPGMPPQQDSFATHPIVPVDMNNIPNTQPLPSSTPTSSLSEASSHSNDSSAMGPVMNNSGCNNMPDSISTSSSSLAEAQSSMDINSSSDGNQITTTANTIPVETATAVTQSITSPVTSISTEAGNSNDSQPMPMEPIAQLQNCRPSTMPSPEPPEKKKKTDSSGMPQLPFARVAPSPGGASVASSGTHEDVDNIGSPGWPSTPKNTGDYMRLYEMGNEMNRRPFLDRLFAFLEDKGSPVTSMPVISKQPLDLFKLYVCVQEKGGMVEVTKLKKWKEICGLVNISGSASAAFTLKKNYIKFLFGFECRYDRNNMDPNPILAQMETDLEKKRNAKNRNRAPSPAGSQCSQDGMPTPYMQNDPSMGHMAPGMMGNHMMNNMGPHGPMMGPNNMGGPHHMGPGMQGPGHMMGTAGPPQQMMGGNSGYMMQGGPNNMMGNSMGPQGGMMGQGMQGPNNMMGPHSGNMIPGNMNPGMMNMNMPPNNMMGPQPGNHGNMMGGGGMMNQQGMRNSMSQQPVPPNSGPGHNFPPTSVGRGSGENSVSCQDPFSDEHFSRGNNSQAPPFSGPLQQNGSTAPQSNSPMPQMAGGPNSQNAAMPSSNANSMPSSTFSSDMPTSSQSQNTQSGPKQETNTSTVSQPHLFNQDSNSSNSMSMDSIPSFPVKTEAPQSTHNSSFPVKSEPSGQTTQNTSISQPGEGQANSSQYSNSTTPPTSSSSTSGRQFPFGDQFTKPERFDMSSPVTSQQQAASAPASQAPMTNPQHGPMMNQQANSPMSHGPMSTSQANSTSQPISQGPMNPMMSQGPMMSQQSNPTMSQGPMNTPMSQGQMNPSMSQAGPMSQQSATPMSQGGPMMNQMPNSSQSQGAMNPAMSSQQGGPAPQGQMGQHSASQGQMVNPQSNTTMSQGHQNPVMSHGVGMNQNTPMSQGQYAQGPMNQPHSMPINYQQQQGMNQPPHMNSQQPPMEGGYQGRFGPQQSGPEHFNSNYSGNQGYGQQPMMNNDQFQGYPNQPGPYGKPPMNRDMSGSIYNTPNKRFPDREQFMTPAYGLHSYGSSPMNYGDPNTSNYPPTPHYSDYNREMDFPSDRREGPWSPMSHQRGFHNQPQFGPHGMSPSGPPNMSHIQRRMSPDRNRSYTMSPNKMKMGQGQNMQGPYGKREMHFPMDTVESTQPLLTKRRRLTKHDIGQVDAWRIMMSLKSGLLAESTWALDTLNVLLFDDSTVAYFGLSHLPGLVEVLLDHFRRCLIDMFDLFDETQIGCGHDDFKQNLIRMAILESSSDTKDTVSNEEREIKRANKTIGKLEEQVKLESGEDSNSGTPEKTEPTDKTEGVADVDDKCTNNENEVMDVKSRTNYSFISRQGKEVKVEEGSEPNGLLDDKYWDVYCEFGDQSELWEFGKGDVTEHIKTHFEIGHETKQCSKRFFRKPMKLKDSSDSVDSKSVNSKSIKCENKLDSNLSNAGNSKQECYTKSNEDTMETEKMEYSSDCNDHTCNKFINGVTKAETRDVELEKNDSSEEVSSDEKFNIAEKYFRDEPRMKLAVKYEKLDSDELVRKCKNSFGINTEGERMSREDESYQRNEPPLCLISEAQNEIGARCVCISNIFRSLSCIPGNDLEMSRHAGLVYILGKLLLLHHKHLPRSRVRRKFDRDDVDETMVDTTQGMDEWWWDYLNMLRENTLVIFANVCAQLRLDKFPDEICVPVLQGLVHWVVCPSSCASDPLPTVSSNSVLSPLRLVLEAMCKLCIHDKNVDMLLATPPYERIVQLFSVLTKLLANKSEQVTVEFSIVLLSELVKGGSSAARVVALQHPCISLLIDFLETAEQKASQVANMRSIQLLRDNPEMMGTSLDMIRRAATVLLHLAMVPDNRKMFVHQQSRLLSLVMSQILDQTVATILSDVLFQCSS